MNIGQYLRDWLDDKSTGPEVANAKLSGSVRAYVWELLGSLEHSSEVSKFVTLLVVGFARAANLDAKELSNRLADAIEIEASKARCRRLANEVAQRGGPDLSRLFPEQF